MSTNEIGVVPRNGGVFRVLVGGGRLGKCPAGDARANPPQSPFGKGGSTTEAAGSKTETARVTDAPSSSGSGRSQTETARSAVTALRFVEAGGDNGVTGDVPASTSVRAGSSPDGPGPLAGSSSDGPVPLMREGRDTSWMADPEFLDRAGRLALEPTLAQGINDHFHAGAIVTLFGDRILHCRKLGGFLTWNGFRWKDDDSGEMWRYALCAAATIHMTAKDVESDNRRARLKRWALQAERRRDIENALRQLQSHTKIAAGVDEFDRDPWLFTVKNGTIDLRTGELREHRREDRITKLAPVEYDPACGQPRLWLRFLSEIFDGNAQLLDFVQRACGYALSGSACEQKLFFLHGEGANGKTTFLETLMRVMGGYACRLPATVLFSSSSRARASTLGELRGRRLAVTGELESGRRLAEARAKEITGGDRLPGGHTRRTRFDFEPTHTLFVCGNHLPTVRGRDHAIWRRIDLIPFAVTIPEQCQDKDLRRKLLAEAPGILNWLVAGCIEWRRKGLAEPPEVTEATREYRSNMDILGDFLSERCVTSPDAEVTSSELFRAYDEWCEKNGERRMSATALGLRLKERGFASKRTRGARVWGGIDLRKA